MVSKTLCLEGIVHAISREFVQYIDHTVAVMLKLTNDTVFDQ